MTDNIYLNNEYYAKNPTWDIEDSPWKAKHVLAVLNRIGMDPKHIVEVGCGAGEILNQLYDMLPPYVELTGYEISPKAFELCQTRKKERLNFILGDIPGEAHFDVLLALDVLEHVEDYLGFLRAHRESACVKIFHIPLDMSVKSVAKVEPIIHARNSVGHLHYFSKETALRTLSDCGYEIVDWFYTGGPANRPPRMKRSKLSGLLLDLFKLPFYRKFTDNWVRFLGGSMMVVTK